MISRTTNEARDGLCDENLHTARNWQTTSIMAEDRRRHESMEWVVTSSTSFAGLPDLTVGVWTASRCCCYSRTSILWVINNCFPDLMVSLAHADSMQYDPRKCIAPIVTGYAVLLAIVHLRLSVCIFWPWPLTVWLWSLGPIHVIAL